MKIEVNKRQWYYIMNLKTLKYLTRSFKDIK